MNKNYDFSGWATKNNVRCSDGRTILRDAFKDDNGKKVPLVWNHDHNEPENVLGHAILENRDEGVYAYGYLNDTPRGKHAKEAIKHGDVMALSIYANQLKEKTGNVIHGAIREVSLVLAGANPEATIDTIIRHGEVFDDEVVVYFPEQIELSHADDQETTKEEAPKEEKVENNEETVMDVFNTLSEKQKNAVYAMIAEALKSGDKEDDTEEKEEEKEDMKHNVFDEETNTQNNYLSHSDMQTIFRDAKRLGSLKEAVSEFTDGAMLQHDDETAPAYGITRIDALFPDYKNLNVPPEFIQRDNGWVTKFMSGVHHTPFTRIKSMFANITEDEARAKGYFKGKLKKEEVFSLLKRTTDPQTIYKKQKLDRDDVIDITDFDVVAWIKREMRVMLDEEIARACLIGDGRLPSDDDRISPDHVRPIALDSDLFAVKVKIAGSDIEQIIREIIRARRFYKGSGNPTFFTTEEMLTEMLLVEDGISHLKYADEAALARALRVKEIVTVPVMEGFTINNKPIVGIMVNLQDYTIGADKGGNVEMFDDFDIDYNQMKYLMETRISAALTKPYSALVITSGETTTSHSSVDPSDAQEKIVVEP